MKTPGCFPSPPLFPVALSTASSNRSLEACQDEFQGPVDERMEAKLKGKTVLVARKPGRAPVIDRMQALKKRLAAQRIGKPHKRAAGDEHCQHQKAG